MNLPKFPLFHEEGSIYFTTNFDNELNSVMKNDENTFD